MIIINFKNYLTNLPLIKRAQLVEKYLPKAIAAVPLTDIFEVTAETKLKIFAEHVDWQEKGRATGFIIPENVKEDGAVGTLLNHSEHKLPFEIIKKTVERVHNIGLKVVLCAESLEEAGKFKKLNPFAIAFEDLKLVGSGKSITTYKADDVEKFGKMFTKEKIIPLCGAGVNNANDVKKAFELGCKGVLISSAIANVSSEKAEKFLKDISFYFLSGK